MGPDDGRASHPFDQERAEKAVRELLLALGEDPEREGLRDTPARVARAFKENFEGLWQRPQDVLTTTFDIGHEELVIIRDIEVFSHCEHHLTPFHGVAHVGYIPSGKITGLSKVARLVDSPPTSMMSTPSSTISKPRAMATCVSKLRPPSAKESGVTLRIPMTNMAIIDS